MAASVFDSPLFAHLFPTGEAGRLFSDSAMLRALLLVEGALAKAQGHSGLIPEISAAAIQRASLEIQIDPGAIAKTTGQDGVCVPGLVAAFRAEMNAPEHARYVHWGATSQDIIDTGLMLRLRQALALAEADLESVLSNLAAQADAHSDTVMPARTYAQHATPTTWGAVLAHWGHPLADAVESLPDVRAKSLWVSLSGAAGTASALGADAPALRARLAEGLGLNDPQRSWHSDRGPVLRIANWMAQVTTALAVMGTTLVALSSSDTKEVAFGDTGQSSTMPQKQNPVAASALVALSHQMTGLHAAMSAAGIHQHQRDGAAWFTEWMTMSQLALTLASALQIAKSISSQITPQADHMARALNQNHGLTYAEALSFELSKTMPRSQAQAATKELCAEAAALGQSLSDVARAAYPDLPASLFDPHAQIGQAQNDARRFAARIKGL